MSVICQCPSCKVKYQIADQYAGRTVKCPKCSAAVAVPAMPSASSPQTSPPSPTKPPSSPPPSASVKSAVPPKSIARAVRITDDEEDEPTAKPQATEKSTVAAPQRDPISAPQRDLVDAPQRDPAVPPPIAEMPASTESSDVEPAEDLFSFLANAAPSTKRSNPKHPTSPLFEENEPAAETPTEDFDAGSLDVDALGAAKIGKPSAHGSHSHHRKKKKPQIPAWLIATVGGITVAAVAGIGVAVYHASRPKPVMETAADSVVIAGSDAQKPARTTSQPKVPMLQIEWPEEQRRNSAIFVDDVRMEVPPAGPILIPVPPRQERYKIRCERKGFEPYKIARVFQGDDDPGACKVPEWRPLVLAIDWEQDFEAAKKQAATGSKSILLVFDASDVAANKFASGRFTESVALSSELREHTTDYVRVYIDNPTEAEAAGRVENVERNKQLTEKYRIRVFPTVVAADAKGHPFGVLEGYSINGITAFIELLTQWNEDRKLLADELAQLDAMPEDRPNAEVVGKFLDFLEANRLDRFYRSMIQRLAAKLPQDQKRPVSDVLASAWAERFERAWNNVDEALKAVAEFDAWKKTRSFTNREMAAGLHLLAARLLVRVDHRSEAAEKCKEGLAYEPRSGRLRTMLQEGYQVLAGGSGKRSEMAVGSGTGFCVADGNFVLTNHHVIDGAHKIMVRLNGKKEKYPAALIADNERGDMALLQVAVPAEHNLVAIPLMATDIKTGEDVCALGFPEIGSQSTTPTVTKGIVSTVPDAQAEDAYIVTDCRVNPGNSGGPMCNFYACIAGMVTKKSRISTREDSYGMVIPASRLRRFLKENLPEKSRQLPSAKDDANAMNLKDINEQVSPSVVYIENIQ